MEVLEVAPSEIMPYLNNPRENEKAVSAVVKSIMEFGFRNPIIVDGEGVIIAGHTRWKAALQLELKKVPVIYARDLPPEKVQAYRLADNKVGELAEWDDLKLMAEIDELFKAGWNINDLGFSNKEVDDILQQLHQNEFEGLTEDDAIPEKVETRCKPGDFWKLGKHYLICGDSRIADDVEKLLQGNRPILMVTDPPYGVEYDPEWREGADLGVGKRSKGKVKNDDIIDWSESYSLFEGNVCYIWHAGRYAKEVQDSIEKCDFEIISQIIWAKHHLVLSRGDYHWKHEPCWYAVRKDKKHNWQGARDQTTVWEIRNNNSFGNPDKEKTFGHSTQKPIECMLRPIKNNSAPGQQIYDPFGGSGTTLIAAEKLNRQCFMMEIDPGYCDVIIQRWEDYTGKTAELVE